VTLSPFLRSVVIYPRVLTCVFDASLKELARVWQDLGINDPGPRRTVREETRVRTTWVELCDLMLGGRDMTSEELLAQNRGAIDALTNLCGVLLATHPMWAGLARIFLESCDTAAQSGGRSPLEQAYSAGYGRAAAGIYDALRTVRTTKQLQNLRP
jgi:hypothetical protein